VDEVQNIMRSNVEKVLERDGKLSQLEDRASRLQEGTEQVINDVINYHKVKGGFSSTARR